mmetsp:Transcript_85754/g.135435  ORF Transcript_85754/g.135435 Transcript_85754/m.135435 type:complete len:538 (-) Transcript_85754:105-1718(-)|eukprot:CAMPEP_0169102140 /NCGR_PEP_ID=MMETSP1015-20121227/22008_1 /TAXON_ID=342587 /ORGANISM="Karlodinium micrum, Strain CCMP2283" /LENGTH=537 /DNA_ID=CAMNT_0009163221 /DNA_START=39 /DNA_END=1652 /DNA_ORIENTATION=+
MTAFSAHLVHGSQASVDSTVSVEAVSEHVSEVVTTREWRRTTVRSVTNRKVAVVERRQDRWEVEVARSVGSSACHAQTVKERRTDRSTMKSAGAYVAEFVATCGTGVTPEESEASRDRVRKRRLEQKKEAVAAEAAQAAEKAAKIAAKRVKAKQVRQRHELHLREVEERRTALEIQAKQDQEVVRDIRARRAEIHRALAEDEAAGKDLECTLQYAMPAPWLEAAYSSDQEVVQNIIRRGNGAYATFQKTDDEAIRRLVGKEGLDDTTIRRLMGHQGADAIMRKDEEALRMIIGKDGIDDGIIRRLIGKDADLSQAAQDDAAFRFILDSAANSEEAQANALALRTLAGFNNIEDPMSGTSRFVRQKLKAKLPVVVPQAARDMHILNTLMEECDDHAKRPVTEVELRAWKDIGAVNMLLEGLPGIERHSKYSDDDVMQALMSAQSLPANEQADNKIMRDLMAPSSSFPQFGVFADKVPPHVAGYMQYSLGSNVADQLKLQQLMESNEDVTILQDLMQEAPFVSDAQTMRDIQALNTLIR